MKEISVESVDELRIQEEKSAGETFEKYWTYFEYGVFIVNIIMYIFTLTTDLQLIEKFTWFFLVFTLFIALNFMKFFVSEIIWGIVLALSWLLCCKRDHQNHNSSLLFLAINYFSKKSLLLLIMGFCFYHLKTYMNQKHV